MKCHMNMENLFFGDVILVVISSKQVANNGLIRNWRSNNHSILSLSLRKIDFFSRKESPFPYCISSPKPSLSKRICAYTYDKIVMCNVVEYPHPLPMEYQVCHFFVSFISIHQSESFDRIDLRFSSEYH